MPLPAAEPAPRLAVYEQPLNERVRTFLRLEFLFDQLQHHAAGPGPHDTRATLNGLLEVIAILGKGDIRTEVLKELERHTVLLTKLKLREDVDKQRALNILDSLDKIRKRLDTPERQLARDLRESEFLATIRNRATIPGGTCGFDLPALQFWLNLPAEQRAADVGGWLEQLEPLRRALRLILMLTRESALPTREVAHAGLFQMNLESGLPYQLLRVLVAAELGVFPEISAGKHRFTVRFLERPDVRERPHQTTRDVAFQLVCCQF
jgi:cell division protein ZapD